MLKKEFRLKKRQDFLRVKAKAKITWGKFFGISILPKDRFKLGFIVTKKVMSKAVDRNRFRRIFCEALLEVGKPKAGWVVVVAKKEAVNLKMVEIKNEILSFENFKTL